MTAYHHGVSPEARSPALDAAAPRELRFVVAGMTCEHCRAAITQEVGRVAGVTSVEVDLDARLVTVRGSALDGAAVVAAIDEAGYEGKAAA